MSTGQKWRSIQEEEDLLRSQDRFSRGTVLTASAILLLITVLIFWPILQYKVNPVSAEVFPEFTQLSTGSLEASPTSTAADTPTPTHTATSLPTSTPTPKPSPTLLPVDENASALNSGTILISLNEAGNFHLFAYQPFDTPYTRLTSGPWDDITPALSPDGQWLAFSSNRSGVWDLYLLDLRTGDIRQLTDTPHFEASPTWSPDGNLLAYESYDGNYEILIRSVFDDRVRVNLSEHPAADYQPSWSPQGRKVAFISDRSGEPEVWIADFDAFDENRFTNASQSADTRESHPTWVPDGSGLAWAARREGDHQLIAWDPEHGSQYVANGDWPVWSPDGRLILTVLQAANQDLLTAYQASNSLLALPPMILPGPVSGLTWNSQALIDPLPTSISQFSAETPASPWSPPAEDRETEARMVPLANIEAPYPELHDAVDDAFQALRLKTAEQAGWDFLASLENAYLPLSAPLPPGMGDDWLYTGRAFAFDTQTMNAGWVVAVPEIFGGQAYWRVYLKARNQDGSLGKPLVELPWNFNARFAEDPLLYEQGGFLEAGSPEGYWVDFTSLAQSFGWQRLPALPIWQSAFYAARVNEFVLPAEKTWQEAMLELYSLDALITPTPIYPPTLTPTRTPSWPISSSP